MKRSKNTSSAGSFSLPAVLLIAGLLFCYAGTSLLTAGELREFPAGTPLYSSPSVCQLPAGFLGKKTLPVPVVQIRKERIDRHPVSAVFSLYQIGKENGPWAVPQFRAEKSPDGSLKSVPVRDSFLLIAALVSAGLVLIAAAACFLKRLSLAIAGPVILLFLHGADLLFMRAVTPYYPHPVDELSYFRIAGEIASGQWASVWNYTIGWPLAESLLIRLFRWTGYGQAEPFLLFFNGLFLTGLLLVLAFFILRKVLRSEKKALAALLLWKTGAFFLRFRDFWHPLDQTRNIYCSFFALPDWTQPYYIYCDSIARGFHALSEPLSLSLLFGGMLLLLQQNKKQWLDLPAGALLGAACLVRINNVLFLPLLILLFRDGCSDWKERILRLCRTALPFLLVFSLQLAVNWQQFGSPLTFPYVLHNNDVSRGFLLRALPNGTKFLMSVNYFWFAAGVPALLWIRDRQIRSVLTLWIAPLTLFFCGYPEAGNNGIRFLLPVYAALAGAMTEAFLQEKDSRKIRLLLISVLLFQILLTAPAGYAFTSFLPWNMEKLSRGTALSRGLDVFLPMLTLGTAFICRREKGPALLTGFISIVYASGLVFLPAILLAGALCRTLIEMIRNFLKPHP